MAPTLLTFETSDQWEDRDQLARAVRLHPRRNGCHGSCPDLGHPIVQPNDQEGKCDNVLSATEAFDRGLPHIAIPVARCHRKERD